jgi:hypothetical protein
MEGEFEIPTRLESLSVEEVAQCLKLLNMKHYVEQFRKEHINGSLLITLTEDLLISLGVNNKLHRTKLLKFIEGWRPKIS